MFLNILIVLFRKYIFVYMQTEKFMCVQWFLLCCVVVNYSFFVTVSLPVWKTTRICVRKFDNLTVSLSDWFSEFLNYSLEDKSHNDLLTAWLFVQRFSWLNLITMHCFPKVHRHYSFKTSLSTCLVLLFERACCLYVLPHFTIGKCDMHCYEL